MPVSLVIALVGIVAGGVAVAVRSRSDAPVGALEDRAVETLESHPTAAEAVARHSATFFGLTTLAGGVGTIFVLTLIAGSMFDMVDNEIGFGRWDASVAEWGAAHVDGTSAELLDLATSLGGTPIITAVTAAVGLWGWWRWKQPAILLYLIAVAGGQALVNNAVKWVVERERPNIAQLADWSGFSFPSGHSAAAAATYAGVALVLSIGRRNSTRSWLAGGAVALAVAIAATRALLGVHWLTDIIAGLAVGWAWFALCTVVFGGRLMSFGHPKERIDASEAASERNTGEMGANR